MCPDRSCRMLRLTAPAQQSRDVSAVQQEKYELFRRLAPCEAGSPTMRNTPCGMHSNRHLLETCRRMSWYSIWRRSLCSWWRTGSRLSRSGQWWRDICDGTARARSGMAWWRRRPSIWSSSTDCAWTPNWTTTSPRRRSSAGADSCETLSTWSQSTARRSEASTCNRWRGRRRASTTGTATYGLHAGVDTARVQRSLDRSVSHSGSLPLRWSQIVRHYNPPLLFSGESLSRCLR